MYIYIILYMSDIIDKIISESISSVVEGLNLDPLYGDVSLDANHQDYVDTNDAWSPHPFYSRIGGYKVISIFRNKWNHNPLIWALKGKKWRFKNPREDVMFLLRRFVAVTKELNERFDVIITTPSSSELNNRVLGIIERLIPHKYSFKEFFRKREASEVYNALPENVKINLRPYFEEMMRNGNLFSYKYIPIGYRGLIGQTINVSDISLGNKINGMRVLILDDTVTTGKTITDSAKALLDTFVPKSVTFLTLMTPEE